MVYKNSKKFKILLRVIYLKTKLITTSSINFEFAFCQTQIQNTIAVPTTTSVS